MPQKKNTRKARQAARQRADAETRFYALPRSKQGDYRRQNREDPVEAMMAAERRQERHRRLDAREERRPAFEKIPNVFVMDPWKIMNDSWRFDRFK